MNTRSRDFGGITNDIVNLGSGFLILLFIACESHLEILALKKLDLVKKLSSLIEGDVILKYQLIPEELDALVTVKSDEDLRHMLEEYERNEMMGAPRLRTFLFPATLVIQTGPMDRQSLEQRYINSINGIIFSPTPAYRPPGTVGTTTISSAGSSPRTPPDQTTTADVINPEITGLRNKLGTMAGARSSPSLCNLGKNPGLNLGLSNQQYYRQPQYVSLHHHPHPHSCHSPKPPLDPQPHKNFGPGTRDYYREQAARARHMVYQRGSSPYDDYYGNSINRHDRESPPAPSNYVSKWGPV